MQLTAFISALFLAGAAVASCPDGPYATGTGCAAKCLGFQRCGDNNNVIQCEEGTWVAVQQCNHCKGGGCA